MNEYDILDDFSALHNLKEREGLHRDTRRSVIPYLKQARFFRAVANGVSNASMLELEEDSGLTSWRIRELVEHVVREICEKAMNEAAEILDEHGIVPCLQYLNIAAINNVI